jgi:ankyrin repeat protein
MGGETMLRNRLFVGLSIAIAGLLAIAGFLIAAGPDSRVADAAMKGDRDLVRSLIKEAADVNAAQGDGMTALHWAAQKGDAEMAQLLIYAGANLRAATRIGGYTPLFMAGEAGQAKVIDVLLKAGADAKAVAMDGFTPLMMAAMGGDSESVQLLLDAGADPNAAESERGQTPLIFAAAFDHPEAIKLLLAHGAKPDTASKIVQPLQLQQRADGGGAVAVVPTPQKPANGQTPQNNNAQQQAQQAQQAQQQQQMNGADAGTKGGGNPKAGLTPLMYAARQGNIESARTLLDGGANIDAGSADHSTALLLAVINGHFDFAKEMIDRGADVNIRSMDGATPLYGVVNTQWARKSFHPQPTTRYEKISYLDLMTTLLDKGAAPNARLTKELWYSEYNFSLESASAAGTTAFWKCAEVGDIEGMKLLVSRGADPNIASNDGVTALLMVAGAGVHGNDDITAPTGRLAAVKYLVEELNADVNAADTGGNNRVGVNAGQDMQQLQAAAATPTPADGKPATPGAQPSVQQQLQQGFAARSNGGGFTALHNAAARGDNEMILYLVSKGARVDAVAKNGTTIVDMANGPRQRIQPYPETVALLEMLGAKNSHKCVSC